MRVTGGAEGSTLGLLAAKRRRRRTAQFFMQVAVLDLPLGTADAFERCAVEDPAFNQSAVSFVGGSGTLGVSPSGMFVSMPSDVGTTDAVSTAVPYSIARRWPQGR
jgi:hypothetical protein